VPSFDNPYISRDRRGKRKGKERKIGERAGDTKK